MIVVDTSVIVSAFLGESDREVLIERMLRDASRAISAGSVLEASIVLRSKRVVSPSEAEAWLETFLQEAALTIEPLTAQDAVLARDAHIRFGKGTGHPAQLNFGDCFSYALAKRLGAPLLYKRDDFSRTDIEAAL